MAGFCNRIGVTLLADGGCRVDDNGRGIPVDPYPSGPHKGKSAAEVVLTVLHAGGKFGGAGLQGVRWPARRRRQRRQRAVRAAAARGRPRRQALPPGVRQGRQAAGQDRSRRQHAGTWSQDGYHRHVLAGSDDLRRRGDRVRLPHRARAAADDGVPESRPGDRLHRRACRRRNSRSPTSTRAASSTSSSTSTRPRRRCSPKVCHYEDSDEEHQTLDIAIQWNTGYYEGIHGYANGISTTEGGMHVEGFRTALTTVVNKYARLEGSAQGEGRQPARRGHPRGLDGDRLGEAARSAVRGPDQGQARQRPDALVRPEGDQRAPRRVARGEPDRGQQGRQEGASPRRKPESRRRTPATPSVARRRCRARACRTS